MEWDIRFIEDFASGEVGLYIRCIDSQGNISIVEDVKMKKVREGDLCSPSLRIASFAKQKLRAAANDLAAIGIVSEVSEGRSGELVAVKYHLEDMRQLAGLKKVSQ